MGPNGAGAVILIIPAIFIAFFVGKYLVQGLTKGALKNNDMKRPNIIWYCTDQQRFDTITASETKRFVHPTWTVW